ncbi:Xaa-Pro dipeptidyl-peptidase [Streptomyces sp. VRA16 Mangrove soil]|uniref:Xaa-Pro dipeptidyl-peptidase n=1 Tax=Streptomyces sp. VRA16 Mangrove soil TaxID=2817434 RepID=UPI001A9FE140|nr:Xaa-Pro dipeptidyl-peptidase [Streptomyces sp. VRA16 Mangrove soil]MBO1335415.1 Xaa-Pro dipeptidyl-peptidase [Streptomyces sp. VRA16 Mangrove soil]
MAIFVRTPGVPGRRRPRGGLVLAAAGALVMALAAPAAYAAGQGPEQARPEVSGGETQPVFSRADAVYQQVDIQTEVDSDGDGKRDTVRMRILRPKETDTARLKVATIIEASPYWAGGNDVPNHGVDLDEDGLPLTGARAQPAAGKPGLTGPAVAYSGYYDNYFLPRGYAVAQVDSLGTGGSTGCPTSGGRNETLGAKAAVDWLGGRAKGWDLDGNPVRADWSTGNAAMMGISYNGTLPTAVATTGVKGLKAIVPISGISSWYDYYRANGGVVAPGTYQGEDTDVLARYVYSRADQEICKPVLDSLERDQDRVTGDWSAYWDERDYIKDVGKIKAGVFVVHGLNDWNVKTKNAGQLWEALKKNHVPRKLWLHQAGHANPMPLRMEEWLRQVHHWFDYWLYGIDNGVLDEPQVDVEQADFSWKQQSDWPAAGTRDKTLRLRADGSLGTAGGPATVQSLTDAGRTVPAEQLVTSPDAANPNRLAYTTGVLDEDVRLNGVPSVDVRASLAGSSPYVTALLVDYGRDTRATSGTVTDTSQQVCYGQAVPGMSGETGCAYRSKHATETADFKIVTRGWLDARNRVSYARQSKVVEGREYRLRWDMQPEDYVFKAGHRLGVVLISTDYDYTLRYPAGTRMTVRAGVSSLTLPVASGR